MSVFTNPASGSVEHAKAYTAATLELLGDQDPVTVLRETSSVLKQAIEGLTSAQMATPEAAGKWSMAQMLQHLADTELVWGYRLRMVLAENRPPLVGYDQDLWAERLGYHDTNAGTALEDFACLRRANLRLIAKARAADLARVGIHSERGEESVGHMIRMNAGHDLLHQRQLDRIRRAVAAV
jgi:DinB family protein